MSYAIHLNARRINPRFTLAGLDSIPRIRASVESAIMSAVTLDSHSKVSSSSFVCLTSTEPITFPLSAFFSTGMQQVSLTRRVRTRSLSIPSTTLPNIPSRCHRTISSPTLMATRWVCTTTLVDKPVNSPRSLGSRRV